MKDFNSKTVEKYGFKAYRKGFFKEWQVLTSSISENQDLSFDEASKEAYKYLKLQGSE
jgi:hypothetical protein